MKLSGASDFGMWLEDRRINEQVSHFPRRNASWSGGNIDYRDVGSGADIVLLHGIGSSSASWLNVFSQWHGRARLIAWDAPGYGNSTPFGRSAPTATEYANALTEFVDYLDLGKPHLVGHSLGAIVAMSFAAAHPDKLSKLMLVDPARGYGSDAQHQREEKLSSRLSVLDTLGPIGMASKRAEKLLSQHASEEARALVRWNMSKILPHGYAQASNMLASADILNDARGVDGPVLVVCGTEDQITPPSLAKTIADALPNSVYRDIPRAGHASYIEQPETFIEILTEWIEV